MADYDVIVVGAGLIGSAAARHLVESSTDVKVLLIGPEEPKKKDAAEIFASHYDEGRITKVLEPTPGWAVLAQRAVKSYRDLERRSGIKFYHEVGYMLLGYKNQPSTYDVETTRKMGETIYSLDEEEIKKKFPYLETRSDHVGLFTPFNSGFINPRLQVKAQKVLAERGGCDVINHVVKRITPISSRGYEVESEAGHVFKGKKVLVATGCFTHSRDLLPDGLKLDIKINGKMLLLAQVDESDLARFDGMPTILEEAAPGSGYVINSYSFPPIKYPDGKYYIKIGPGEAFTRPIHNPDQLVHWYRYGHDNTQRRFLVDTLHRFFPDVWFRNHVFITCCTTFTPNHHVMIDLVAPGFGVAVAGNGYAGKSGDEIGRVAARMMLKGGWDYDFPQDVFKAKFKTESAKL